MAAAQPERSAIVPTVRKVVINDRRRAKSDAVENLSTTEQLAAAQAELAQLLREHFVPGTTAARRYGKTCEGCRQADAVAHRIVDLRQRDALTESELFAAHGTGSVTL